MKKSKLALIIISSVLVLVGFYFIIIYFFVLGDSRIRNKANQLTSQEKYEEAAELYKKIGDDFRYAQNLSSRGQQLMNEGNFNQAAVYFDNILMLEDQGLHYMGYNFTHYKEALDAIKQEDYETANTLLINLKFFYDSSTLLQSIQEPLKEIRALKRQDEINTGNEQLSKYLASIGYKGSYMVDKEKTPDANVVSLLTQDFFINDKKATAELIGKNQCYEVIMAILNNLYHSYPIGKSSNIYYHKEDLEKYGSDGYYIDFETLLWAIVLLPDLDLPGTYNSHIISAFKESWDLFLNRTNLSQEASELKNKLINCLALTAIDINDLELLTKLYPDVFNNKTLEYSIVHTDIHKKFFEALAKTINPLEYGPKRLFTQREYANLLGNDFIPLNPMNNGYIRITDFSELTPAVMVILRQMNYDSVQLFLRNNDLYCMTNPNNARFAVFEKFSANYIGEYILSGSTKIYKVYLPIWDVKIVDLKTGEAILIDKQTIQAREQYENFNADFYKDDTYIPFSELDKNKYINFMIEYGSTQ